jgi:hypothetical protein
MKPERIKQMQQPSMHFASQGGDDDDVTLFIKRENRQLAANGAKALTKLRAAQDKQ